MMLAGHISYLYLLFVSGIWLLIAVAGDHWWPATLLLFGPRWIWSLPLVVFIPFAAWKDRRMILPLVAALLIIIGPLMGFTFSVSKDTAPSSVKPLCIMTCNLQNGKFNHNDMDAFIRDTQPEIVALQELPSNAIIKSLAGWQHLLQGDLHIFSRYPVVHGD